MKAQSATLMRPPLNIPTLSGSFHVPKELLQDGSASLLDLYDWNGEHNPDHPLFCYGDHFGNKTICWGEVVAATHRAARFFEEMSKPSTQKSIIVAILASTGTLLVPKCNALVIDVSARLHHLFLLDNRSATP